MDKFSWMRIYKKTDAKKTIQGIFFYVEYFNFLGFKI
jgi:hypothetical protein